MVRLHFRQPFPGNHSCKGGYLPRPRDDWLFVPFLISLPFLPNRDEFGYSLATPKTVLVLSLSLNSSLDTLAELITIYMTE